MPLIVVKLILSLSFLLVFLGSIGMIQFATRFPLSTRIKDLEYGHERLCGLYNYY
jgi:hypothetical protein